MASSAQAKQFIETIAPIIQEEAKARGYKVCSPIIAQACLESNYGVSMLSARWNNFFGLKCGSAWKGASVNLSTKEEYTQGQLTTIRDNFRAYSSMEEGVKGYFDFISTKRYSNLLGATSPKEYLEMIKKDGYATAGNYVSSCMGVISRHDLTRFDTQSAPQCNPYKLTDTLLKLGSRGDSVKWLQWELNNRGYALTIDGIFGAKTTEAVKKFQTDRFVDGIAGSQTLNALS